MDLKIILDKLNVKYDENLSAKIKSVKYKKSSKEIFIEIDSNEDLESYLNILIEQALREYFDSSTIHLSYNKISNPYIDEYDLITKEITNYNPSSSSWLNDMSIKIDKDHLQVDILCPSDEVYHSLISNGLSKILQDKLILFDDYKINFVKNINKEPDKELFINKFEEEEKNICKLTELKPTEQSKKIDNIKSDDNKYIYKSGRFKLGDYTKLIDMSINNPNMTFEADIFKIEYRELKNCILASFSVTDYSYSVLCKAFLKDKEIEKFQNEFNNGDHVLIGGQLSYDTFSKCDTLMIRYMEKTEKEMPKDTAQEKRVELRVHTKMSQMNGVTSFSDFAKRAKSFGHKAIAITDVSDVQGFPEAMDASKDFDIKVIYGLDANFVDDEEDIVINYNENKSYNTYVVFDIETTGLSPIRDKITEIGAVKIVDGIITERFSQLINPQMLIPEKVQELTRITNALVENEPTIEEVAPKFYDFIKDSVLVAHNAKFDTAFIRRVFKENDLDFINPILDTLSFARATVKDTKKFNLATLCKKFGVSLVGAHRAVNDAEATAHLFIKLINKIFDPKHIDFNKLNSLKSQIEPEILFESSLSILTKNEEGLKNLYKLVSDSHMKYFNRVAKVPRSLINKYRKGLMIGSGDESGEIFNAFFRNLEIDEVEKIASFYDYLEIQPIDNFIPSLLRNKLTREDIIEINKKICKVGENLGIPVIATSNCFYLDEKDDLVRRIILNGKVGVPDYNAKIKQKLYFRSTDLMLEEFSYLGADKAMEVVVTNTNLINDSIDNVKPIPDGKYPPVIEGSEETLKNITYKKAHEIYGDPLPQIVEARLKKELDSIISNGYAVLYIIAQKLVKKSNDDGYLVGSRGSVGSSFAAHMADITEVNPLPAHYICPQCKYSEFMEDPTIGSGVDLADKNCPKCGHKLNKNGHNIPFEVFLGFYGDKEPDIDLNFAGEYQPNAHKYTEELFGKGYVFRAGTIGKVAYKTAYGYVKKFFENQEDISQTEVDRLTIEATGVKRTSGQHPGGVMICPKSKDIFDFTPIQYPADDKSSGVITTHFDYNFIHGKILKLDILGHDGPTIIKMLEDFIGIDTSKIPLDDKDTLSLFSSGEKLNLDKNIFDVSTGTLGIPEFGTGFVRQMLIDTKPKNFAELVRISGLSHGTDVWLGNAADLVSSGQASLSEVICTREDIMLYLIAAGAENKMAFDTMEKVRKGKGLTDEQIKIMNNLKLPPWYIDSCLKIKYMFPKAHAVAYVMLSFRIAYCKLNYPLAFYATYFTIKLSDFVGEVIINGPEAIKAQIDFINNKETPSSKEQTQMPIYEVALEMYSRGLEFLPVDIYKSKAQEFTIEDKKIRMPLRALTGVGEQAAKNIIEARNDGKFLSKEDLLKRAKVGKSLLNIFEINNVIKDMDDTNQISMFNMF